MEIQHFHQHPLRHEHKENRQVQCQMCKDLILGPTIGCGQCDYFLHKGCADLPMEIQHLFHPLHPLTLTPDADLYCCNACGDDRSGFAFCCDECGFKIGVECALLTPTLKSEGHEHLLTPFKNSRSEGQCEACGGHCDGVFVRCVDCDVNYHVLCGVDDAVPPTVAIQGHDHHLNLTHAEIVFDKFFSREYSCNACRKRFASDDYVYCCAKCNFVLHLSCAISEVQFRERTIRHFSHQHLLTLDEGEKYDLVRCNVCNEYIRGPSYYCSKCLYYIYKKCTELPQSILHHFHPHRLTLNDYIDGVNYQCKACGDLCYGCTYCCDACEFRLDIKCALLMPTISYEGVKHLLALFDGVSHQDYWCAACGVDCEDIFVRCVKCDINFHIQCGSDPVPATIAQKSHKHHLTLTYTNDVQDLVAKNICDACKIEIYAERPFYFCIECNYIAHLRCIITEHPFHPQHSLNLYITASSSTRYVKCNACLKHFKGFSYNCVSCDFNLHVECAALRPLVKYEGHGHLLAFIKQVYEHLICQVCRSKYHGTSYLRCVDCDFNLHLLCAPLPETFKSICHMDPLTLEDCVVEDDLDEFYCDACETERDPEECVYYCALCDFSVHMSCVIFEVLLLLSGEKPNVKLRRPDRQRALEAVKKGSTLDDFIEMLTEEEKEEFIAADKSLDEEINVIREELLKSPHENVSSNLKFNSYSEKTFIRFMGERLLNDVQKGERILWNGDSQFVSIGNYKVPRNLAPILEGLFSKYGDFGAETDLGPRMKTFCLTFFASVIDNMCNIKVMDVNKILLMEWWHHCKILQNAGFKVQFAFNQINRIAYTRFAIGPELDEGGTLGELQKDISRLSRESEEVNKRFEVLKEKQKQYISSTRSMTSSLQDEYLK
ncbi:hypothetical protein HS088_TW15G00422 [Tripterygium wilfordii]|uniref:Cysteine/Histidine-rich C1 domain family protein n=1 Tax=Tripterygium wilfordii TaxID=458696 RepID=A0A7J7CLH9_TRIWF|nr:hypothetical protein HS088_TW15G00422 [Tripterygium wilfordii]